MISTQTFEAPSPVQVQMAQARHKRLARMGKRKVSKQIEAIKTYATPIGPTNNCVSKYRLAAEIWPEGRPLAKHRPLRKIALSVAAKHGVTIDDLLSSRRAHPLPLARQEAMWRMRNETTHAMPSIGKCLNRDHTTVIYGIRRHEERMAKEPAFSDLDANIVRRVSEGLPDVPAVSIRINNHSQ